MKKILCVAHDPGGAKVLAPVAAALTQHPGLECAVYGSTYAEGWMRDLGLQPQPLSPTAERIFRETRPDLLVTATSWGAEIEQELRNLAATAAIPSVVVMDFWTNYAKRFLHAGYGLGAGRDTLCLPDEGAAAEAEKEGFARSSLAVTGQPHLDYLAREGARFRGPEHPDGAVFLSEDYPEGFLRSLPEPPLLAFAGAFSDRLAAAGATATFALKLHPKETADPFLRECLARVRALPGLRLEILEQASSLVHQLGRFRFAFGYQSMALFEARALGLSSAAMPLLKGDPYPSLAAAMDKMGIGRLPPRRAAARGWLDQSVVIASVPSPYLGAVERIVDLVVSRAGGN